MLEHRFIKALLRQPVDKTPLWLMRQAGRYLPEYRKLRADVSNFLMFCKTPELACEATLQPLRRFDLDAAIIFSDILTIPDALNVGLEFAKGEGPIIHQPIRSAADVAKLPTISVVNDLSYVGEAIKLTKKALNNKVPLIGFAGSPWTVACYMVEGSGSKTFFTIREMLYKNPEILTALLEKLTQLTHDYLQMQVDAGADVIMIFDTWGGLLTPKAYQEFSLRYMRQLAKQIKVPVILFSKGADSCLEMIADSDCQGVGVDWTIDIGEAKRRIGDRVAVQGNLDPAVLLSTPEKVQAAARDILNAWGPAPGHIFNLGHGIDLKTPIENVQALVEEVHS